MFNTGGEYGGHQGMDAKTIVELCSQHLPDGVELSDEESALLMKHVESAIPEITKAVNEAMRQIGEADKGFDPEKVMTQFLDKITPCFQSIIADVMLSFDEDNVSDDKQASSNQQQAGASNNKKEG